MLKVAQVHAMTVMVLGHQCFLLKLIFTVLFHSTPCILANSIPLTQSWLHNLSAKWKCRPLSSKLRGDMPVLRDKAFPFFCSFSHNLPWCFVVSYLMTLKLERPWRKVSEQRWLTSQLDFITFTSLWMHSHTHICPFNKI